MEKLFIKIGNEVIYPQKPKAYVWRKIMEFDEKRFSDASIDDACEYIDSYATIIADVFSDSKVTKDSILENIDLDDILPLYNDCYRYVASLITAKMKQIPNVETPIRE